MFGAVGLAQLPPSSPRFAVAASPPSPGTAAAAVSVSLASGSGAGGDPSADSLDESAGVSFDELVERLVERALARSEAPTRA